MALCRSLTSKLSLFNSSRRLIMSSSWNLAKAKAELASNPYYNKYSVKIHQVLKENPEEFEKKLKKLKESEKIDPRVVPPNLQKDFSIKEKKGMKNKTLDSIMNVELLIDKSEKEIDDIWKEYYKTKESVIFASLDKCGYEKFLDKCKSYPIFVLPLPRGDGYEFFMSQYEDSSIHFASLAQYQMKKENCPECLCLTYFSELPQNIVLMLGEYDNNILSPLEASCLVNILQFFYNSPKEFDVVKHFNLCPQTFDYNELINTISNMSIK